MGLRPHQTHTLLRVEAERRWECTWPGPDGVGEVFRPTDVVVRLPGPHNIKAKIPPGERPLVRATRRVSREPNPHTDNLFEYGAYLYEVEIECQK